MSDTMNSSEEKEKASAVVVNNEDQDDKKQAEEDHEGKPTTIGEELFLVHLSRRKGEAPSEDDFDHECRRKRCRTIGEELWDVHMARSKYTEPDFDDDDSSDPAQSQSERAPQKGRRKKANQKKPARCSERLASVLHLRNRDVKMIVN